MEETVMKVKAHFFDTNEWTDSIDTIEMENEDGSTTIFKKSNFREYSFDGTDYKLTQFEAMEDADRRVMSLKVI